jgi:hypothetical protein
MNRNFAGKKVSLVWTLSRWLWDSQTEELRRELELRDWNWRRN